MKNFKNFAKNISTSRRSDREAMENYSLQIKSTPIKDAKKTTELSILSSHMLKRNEQGVWQKRFI
jgi:hypothetical protein